MPLVPARSNCPLKHSHNFIIDFRAPRTCTDIIAKTWSDEPLDIIYEDDQSIQFVCFCMAHDT